MSLGENAGFGWAKGICALMRVLLHGYQDMLESLDPKVTNICPLWIRF